MGEFAAARRYGLLAVFKVFSPSFAGAAALASGVVTVAGAEVSATAGVGLSSVVVLDGVSVGSGVTLAGEGVGSGDFVSGALVAAGLGEVFVRAVGAAEANSAGLTSGFIAPMGAGVGRVSSVDCVGLGDAVGFAVAEGEAATFFGVSAAFSCFGEALLVKSKTGCDSAVSGVAVGVVVPFAAAPDSALPLCDLDLPLRPHPLSAATATINRSTSHFSRKVLKTNTQAPDFENGNIPLQCMH